MVPSSYLPSSRLSYEMLLALRQRQGTSLLFLVTLSFPGGNTRRYAYGPGVAVVGTGQFEGLIVEMGSIPRSVSDYNYALQDTEVSITLDDSSGDLAALVEGAYARQLKGSTATITLGSADVPSFCWYTLFGGVVLRWEQPADGRWSFTLGRNQDSIKRYFPRPSIDKSDWPTAPDESLAVFGPIVYGRHYSIATTGAGAVPLIRVSDTLYLVTWGCARSVSRLYVNGVEETSGWSFGYALTASGRRCTLVTFAADPGENVAVDVDMEGLEDAGDGSGALISNPATQLSHIITNWITQDYKAGPWFATSSGPVSESHFIEAAAAFDRQQATGARRIFVPERIRGREAIEEWATCWQTPLFWTDDGKLAIRELPIHHLHHPAEQNTVRHDDTPFVAKATPDFQAPLGSVAVKWAYNDTEGKFLRFIEVTDPDVTSEEPGQLQMSWCAGP